MYLHPRFSSRARIAISKDGSDTGRMEKPLITKRALEFDAGNANFPGNGESAGADVPREQLEVSRARTRNDINIESFAFELAANRSVSYARKNGSTEIPVIPERSFALSARRFVSMPSILHAASFYPGIMTQ